MFVPDDDEWELGLKKNGMLLGDVTWWRSDGTVVCKSHFDETGKLHGTCRRFHPDGDLSMESRYVHGVRWGKTWHTRSRNGDSPENVHLDSLPPNVFRVEYAYINGQTAPLITALTREGLETPPKIRLGCLVDFAADIPKVAPGTAFLVTGGPRDIAGRAIEARAIFYLGPATEDHSMLRFSVSLEPPSAERPRWQDPNATVIAQDQAREKLFLAVDAMDSLIVDDRPPPRVGVRLSVDEDIVVREVEATGLAARAGLQPKDRLLRVNGREIRRLLDYVEGLRELVTKRSMDLVVERNGKQINVGLRT